MRICVVGTGYVGLVAGACLADSGNTVTCVDSDAQKIQWLEEGYIPIYEPGLEDLVRRNVKQRRLSFATELGAVARAQVVFIAVGTPPGEDGSADLQHVLAAAEGIARAIKKYAVIAIKSTVPVGTADRVREVVARATDASATRSSSPASGTAGRASPRT